MTATKLIALRVLIAIVAVAIFPFSAGLALTALLLFLLVEIIDMFDGLLADYKGHRKPFGGFLDISADQCIETLFWFLFLKYNLVPLWIPSFILVRNTFINLLRMDAIRAGHNMFGDDGMLLSTAARLLVGSRISRGLMVLVKTIGFMAAILLHVEQTYGPDELGFASINAHILHSTAVSAFVLLAFIHLLRGIMITLEARSSLEAFLWSATAAASTEVNSRDRGSSRENH